MSELDSIYASIEKAFQTQIGRLYDVLTSATEDEWKSGVAIERFKAGLKRARSRRQEAHKAVEP